MPQPTTAQIAEALAAFQHQPRPLVIGLLGTTATGKTDTALVFKQQIDTHLERDFIRLINMDSVQHYRELEIGTAKPPLPERRLFALMDWISPAQAYSVADYVKDAEQTIAQALANKQLPMLVGGSMMYFQALQRGLDTLPASNSSVRASLQQELATKGYTALLAELQLVDPVLANRLAANDHQRLVRGLEVYRLCGQPLSSLHTSRAAVNGRTYHILPIVITPDKQWVNQRIAQRLEGMFAQGLVDEVISLKKIHHKSLHCPAFRAIGYRQVLDMLDAKFDEKQLFEKVLFATRQLAKRQRTWLNQWPQAARMSYIENAKRAAYLGTIAHSEVSKLSTELQIAYKR